MHRQSGILLHITSLPSEHGIGDLGPGAAWFADFLAASGQGLWQILPIGPTSPAIGNSPYSSFSAFAANPLLISPDLLIEDGWMLEEDLDGRPSFPKDRCDYPEVEAYKLGILRRAFDRSRKKLAADPLYALFREEQSAWLDDYCLFAAIKSEHGGRVWIEWPAELRDRDPEALAEAGRRLSVTIEYMRFEQFLFFSQWKRFRRMLRDRRIHLVGDAPIYVTFDSADVWANPDCFKLDHDKQPVFVAGVPPDYFSKTGQLWGNPVFDWNRLRERRFDWWVERVRHNLSLYDFVRIDHFRGFAGYWEIPAGEKTAINGQWVDAPGMEFFEALEATFPSLPIIAEDLGVITPDVRELRDSFGLPGMKIVQFCFGWGIGQNGDARRGLHRHPRQQHHARLVQGRAFRRGPPPPLRLRRTRLRRARGGLGTDPSGLGKHRRLRPVPHAGPARPRPPGPHEHPLQARGELGMAALLGPDHRGAETPPARPHRPLRAQLTLA